jgi:hypothetical protein
MRVCAECPEHESAVTRFSEDIGTAIPKSPPAETMLPSSELRKARDTRLAQQLIQLCDDLPWTESPRTPGMGNTIALCVFNNLFNVNLLLWNWL